VKDRWASDWLQWRGYGPFFASVVRAIARQRPSEVGVEITAGAAAGNARSVSVAIESRDAHGKFSDRLKPNVTVQAADGTTVTRTARQVLPGRYETSVVADAAQPLTITVDSAGARASRFVIPDRAAEYRFRPADRTSLASLAGATGGSLGATASAIREASAATPARRALWPALVVSALVCFLIDILLRRVRILETA
jgi:hypothetical protein